MNYSDFIERKIHTGAESGFEPTFMPDFLFDFQKSLVEWAVRKGRCAIFADCGLGKTPMQLTWAQNCYAKTGKPTLILTPLSVGIQTVKEAAKFNFDASQSRTGKPTSPITITNYQQLHKFDPKDFGAVVCDESSILKSFDGAIKKQVTDFMQNISYRLLCTATAAPNDFIELGTSSEAIGGMGAIDMINTFFKKSAKTASRKDEYRSGLYRFRGHSETHFWRWICSWARAVRKPSDLGFNNDDYSLPELTTIEHVITARTPNPDFLIDLPAIGLDEQRKERRRTITERCEKAAELITARNDYSVAWCQLNSEGDMLEKMIDGAVQISGSDDDDKKEEIFSAFSDGKIKTLISKPVIAGFGLNWQHCNHQTFFPSHSFEQWYQAIRRSWRFGQKRPVHIDVISSEGESGVLANMKRKSDQADEMFSKLVSMINNELQITKTNKHTQKQTTPSWL
jgi:hypothetical protein